MDNNTFVPFKPGDWIWTKVAEVWMPGRVMDPKSAPKHAQGCLKKRKSSVLAVVYIITVNVYKIVFDKSDIKHYNNPNKLKYLTKGYSLYLHKSEDMESFVSDIISIEKQLGGNVDIFKDIKDQYEMNNPQTGYSSFPTNENENNTKIWLLSVSESDDIEFKLSEKKRFMKKNKGYWCTTPKDCTFFTKCRDIFQQHLTTHETVKTVEDSSIKTSPNVQKTVVNSSVDILEIEAPLKQINSSNNEQSAKQIDQNLPFDEDTDFNVDLKISGKLLESSKNALQEMIRRSLPLKKILNKTDDLLQKMNTLQIDKNIVISSTEKSDRVQNTVINESNSIDPSQIPLSLKKPKSRKKKYPKKIEKNVVNDDNKFCLNNTLDAFESSLNEFKNDSSALVKEILSTTKMMLSSTLEIDEKISSAEELTGIQNTVVNKSIVNDITHIQIPFEKINLNNEKLHATDIDNNIFDFGDKVDNSSEFLTDKVSMDTCKAATLDKSLSQVKNEPQEIQDIVEMMEDINREITNQDREIKRAMCGNEQNKMPRKQKIRNRRYRESRRVKTLGDQIKDAKAIVPKTLVVGNDIVPLESSNNTLSLFNKSTNTITKLTSSEQKLGDLMNKVGQNNKVDVNIGTPMLKRLTCLKCSNEFSNPKVTKSNIVYYSYKDKAKREELSKYCMSCRESTKPVSDEKNDSSIESSSHRNNEATRKLATNKVLKEPVIDCPEPKMLNKTVPPFDWSNIAGITPDKAPSPGYEFPWVWAPDSPSKKVLTDEEFHNSPLIQKAKKLIAAGRSDLVSISLSRGKYVPKDNVPSDIIEPPKEFR